MRAVGAEIHKQLLQHKDTKVKRKIKIIDRVISKEICNSMWVIIFAVKIVLLMVYRA